MKNIVLPQGNFLSRNHECLQELINRYQSEDNTPVENRYYAVFDMDNTLTVGDTIYNLIPYQIKHLCYAFKPTNIKKILRGDLDPKLWKKKLKDGFSCDDLATDIKVAFTRLYEKGYVSKALSSEEECQKWQDDIDFLEFRAKLLVLMRESLHLYGWIEQVYWYGYLFSGMTYDEFYEVAKASHLYHLNNPKFEIQVFKSPKSYKSICGECSFIQKEGLAVVDEMKELVKAFNDANIDCHIVSASDICDVKAAALNMNIGKFASYIGIGNKVDRKGRILPIRDLKNYPFAVETGKSDYIRNVLMKKYKKGPIFVAGDSIGDFFQLSEFKDTKISLLINTLGNTKINMLRAIALNQMRNRISLDDVIKTNDTLFLIQGRNYNTGKFISKYDSYNIGETSLSENNEELEKLADKIGNNTSISSILSQSDTIFNDPFEFKFRGYKIF